jgi:hypothetical protein
MVQWRLQNGVAQVWQLVAPQWQMRNLWDKALPRADCYSTLHCLGQPMPPLVLIKQLICSDAAGAATSVGGGASLKQHMLDLVSVVSGLQSPCVVGLGQRNTGNCLHNTSWLRQYSDRLC